MTTKEEVLKYLLHSYYEGEYDEELILMFNQMDEKSLEEINQNILCELERNKEKFNQYSGNISSKSILRDIENIHRDKVYSISYLENYGKCPYMFLLNKILVVEEMERELLDFSPLDRGIVTHQVLKEYYYYYKDKIEDHILGKENLLQTQLMIIYK